VSKKKKKKKKKKKRKKKKKNQETTFLSGLSERLVLVYNTACAFVHKIFEESDTFCLVICTVEKCFAVTPLPIVCLLKHAELKTGTKTSN